MPDSLREALGEIASGGGIDLQGSDCAQIARSALAAASSPPALEWRVVGWDEGDLVVPELRDDLLQDDETPPASYNEAMVILRRARAELAATKYPYDHYGLLKRTAAGPWVDVPDDGEGA